LKGGALACGAVGGSSSRKARAFGLGGAEVYSLRLRIQGGKWRDGEFLGVGGLGGDYLLPTVAILSKHKTGQREGNNYGSAAPPVGV